MAEALSIYLHLFFQYLRERILQLSHSCNYFRKYAKNRHNLIAHHLLSLKLPQYNFLTLYNIAPIIKNF